MGQSVALVHNFAERLHYSQVASDEPFWVKVYQNAFPNLVNQMPCIGDNEAQRKGIDRVLLLANGVTLRIDEKKREKEYDDVLLEYVSNDKTGAVGWIEKDLSIDYLAYAFMPSKRCFLFDWQTLRRAWVTHKQDWMQSYKRIPARNATYTTWSIAIPTKTLMIAIAKSMLIQV